MTSVLDGHGYTSDTGSQGHRGYDEEIMFTWLGAAVDIPRSVHRRMSMLGPKLYFLRIPKADDDEDSYFEHRNDVFGEKFRAIKDALNDYLMEFEKNPYVSFEPDNDLPKIPLDHTRDDERAHRYIIRLGKLLAPLRAAVPTWETYGSQGSDYSFDIAIVEDPSRAIAQLRSLARGHALSKGRHHITSEDIPLLIKVVLSTCSLSRSTIFDLLIANNGSLTTSQICKSLNTTKPTALRTMAELQATGLVDREEQEGGYNGLETKITLVGKYRWFLSGTFKALKENDTGKQRKEKKYPLRFQSS